MIHGEPFEIMFLFEKLGNLHTNLQAARLLPRRLATGSANAKLVQIQYQE